MRWKVGTVARTSLCRARQQIRCTCASGGDLPPYTTAVDFCWRKYGVLIRVRTPKQVFYRKSNWSCVGGYPISITTFRPLGQVALCLTQRGTWTPKGTWTQKSTWNSFSGVTSTTNPMEWCTLRNKKEKRKSLQLQITRVVARPRGFGRVASSG